MKLFTLPLITLGCTFSLHSQQSGENLYRSFAEASAAQEHTEALKFGVDLLNLGYSSEEDDARIFVAGLLFEIGNTLIHLARWEEAKFCFMLSLVSTLTDEEISTTFGQDFSREDWLRDNRLQGQLFYREQTKAGEQAGAAKPYHVASC